MAKSRRIIVRGQQRDHMDPAQFAKVLIAIAVDWDQAPKRPIASLDVFDAAIEDRNADPEVDP